MRYEQDLLDTCLHYILNGFSPFVYKDGLFLAKHLCSKDIFESNCHIHKKRGEYVSSGFATEYDILKQCSDRGLWDLDNERKLSVFEKQIGEKRELIPKLLMPSQVTHVENEIKQIQSQILEIKEAKEKFVFCSLERKLLREKRDYLAYLGVHGGQAQKLWKSYEEYVNNDANFVDDTSEKYYETIHGISPSIIRAVARETDARYKLKICSIPSITEISIIFCELKQWCDFYNSIYDLSDKPDQGIISDDDKLDKWLIGRRLKQESEKSVNFDSGKGYTGIVGNKEDAEILGAVKGSTIKQLAKKNGNSN